MLKKQYSKNKQTCVVTFTLPKEAARDAREIRVVGDFNDWAWESGATMQEQQGQYQADVELPVGKTFQFRYCMDARQWENDWAADAYVPSPFIGVDNSVVQLNEVLPPRKINGNDTQVKVAKGAPLRKIEGIGPKLEGILHEAGILHFEDLADRSPLQLREILLAAGKRYKIFDPSTWPEQAQLAADGKWDELKALQKELKGGRR